MFHLPSTEGSLETNYFMYLGKPIGYEMRDVNVSKPVCSGGDICKSSLLL